jgi:hypothetical protein
VKTVLDRQGIHNWNAHIYSEPISEVFPAESLVYLTPDAEDALEVRRLSIVSVEGGLMTDPA